MQQNRPGLRARRAGHTPAWAQTALTTALAAALTACGGGGDAPSADAATADARAAAAATGADATAADAAADRATALGTTTTPDAKAQALAAPSATALMDAGDAQRLAQQATFGPTETLLTTIANRGAAPWVADQIALKTSRYTSGGGDGIHKNTQSAGFCDLPQNASPTCWRDQYSAEPLTWDFFRNAVSQTDQLRQRVAFALQQIVVVSEVEVSGTYGLRNYHNNLLDRAFGNYRDLLKSVVLSPVMGDYLDHVNNDKLTPNENFARELLQLFSIGTCALNSDGTLAGGQCSATYDNDRVRSYAFALTGWTYPAGGATAWGCGEPGWNCQYYGGSMVASPPLRDTQARTLLSGVSVPANATASAALDKVLDSLMQHPNIAPFIGKQLIQKLVGSNPKPAYVKRVATAFNTGRYAGGTGSLQRTFGTGVKGDLAATVAAVLLDADARGGPSQNWQMGHLREPALLFTGVLRALNGRTDGAALNWWWGETLRQFVFRSPSVFNFYPPNYPVAGTTLVGPEFGIHNAASALERLNYVTYLIDWDGSAPDSSIPNAVGTKIDLSALTASADNAGALVDRLSKVALGGTLSAAARDPIVNAVTWWTSSTDAANWRLNRVKAAAWLIFSSPQYQVQR